MNTVSQPSWLLSMFPTHLHMVTFMMYGSKYIIDTSIKVLKWLTNPLNLLGPSMQESLLWRYWMDMVRSRASHQFSSSPSLSATSSPAIGSLTIYKVCPKTESTGNQLTETKDISAAHQRHPGEPNAMTLPNLPSHQMSNQTKASDKCYQLPLWLILVQITKK